MSYAGVYEFYVDRINACPNYGFKSGHEILNVIIKVAQIDPFLTRQELDSIINLCEQAHIKMMEDNYNAGWNQQNP